MEITYLHKRYSGISHFAANNIYITDIMFSSMRMIYIVMQMMLKNKIVHF